MSLDTGIIEMSLDTGIIEMSLDTGKTNKMQTTHHWQCLQTSKQSCE